MSWDRDTVLREIWALDERFIAEELDYADKYFLVRSLLVRSWGLENYA